MSVLTQQPAINVSQPPLPRPSTLVLASYQPEQPSTSGVAFSPNYQGNRALQRNAPANIPDNENCSLWLTNLPVDTTHHELLGALRGTGGRVYAVVINLPNPMLGQTRAAAKVVFFERQAAATVHQRANEFGGGLRVRGHEVRVGWNRVKSAAVEHPYRSRVLLIVGEPSFVNADALTAFFESKFVFQMDEIVTHSVGVPGWLPSAVEYRFGSFRCQAESARIALLREKGHLCKSVFVRDPCQ